MITLIVTPVRRLFPRRLWTAWLMRQQRYLALAAFVYAVPHMIAYLVKLSDASRIVSEAAELGMLTGWLAMLIFVALAVTSNDASMRPLGKGWKTHHRFIYAVAIPTFLHWILTAFEPMEGYIHAIILLGFQPLRFLPER